MFTPKINLPTQYPTRPFIFPSQLTRILWLPHLPWAPPKCFSRKGGGVNLQNWAFVIQTMMLYNNILGFNFFSKSQIRNPSPHSNFSRFVPCCFNFKCFSHLLQTPYIFGRYRYHSFTLLTNWWSALWGGGYWKQKVVYFIIILIFFFFIILFIFLLFYLFFIVILFFGGRVCSTFFRIKGERVNVYIIYWRTKISKK